MYIYLLADIKNFIYDYDNRMSHNTTIFIGLCISCFIALSGCDNLSAGSYPYAETYKISSTEQEVINAVNTFKSIHPELLVRISGLTDGRTDSSDYWYHIYFYQSKENRIVHCWTRPDNNNETIFAVVGVSEGLALGNWKEVNKDFNSSENEKIKRDLERTLVNPIIKIVQDKNGL